MAKKEKEVLEVEETSFADDNHPEPRVYELGFHIDPDLSAEEAKKTYEAIRTKAGTIVAEGAPQKVQLAYTISRSETGGRRDFDTSYFAWIAYEADGAGHEAVTTTAKAESRIFRLIDLRTTKEQAQHVAEMQELLQKSAAEGQSEESEVSDSEIDAALKEVGV